MEIREATTGDVHWIERVAADAWREGHVPIAGERAVEEFLDGYDTPQRVRDAVADTECSVLVAEEKDEGVGFAQLVPASDDDEVFPLSRIYVDPDRWGEGIGSRLLEEVKRRATARGVARLWLGVMAETDRTAGFSEARGFERVDADSDDRLGVERYTDATAL